VKCTILLLLLAYIYIGFLLNFSIVYLRILYYENFFQNWGDYADMSQAVIIYMIFGSEVLLICWFGTRLTHHVRENGLLLLLFTLFKNLRS
jgi:hypothetical protein